MFRQVMLNIQDWFAIDIVYSPHVKAVSGIMLINI